MSEGTDRAFEVSVVRKLESIEALELPPAESIYGDPTFWFFVSAAAGGELECVVARVEGQIKGYLPFVWTTDQTGLTVVNSLPWYGSHGGCFLEGDENGEVRGALLREWGDRCQDLQPFVGTVNLLPSEEPFEAAYRSALPVIAEEQRISQINRLSPVEEDLLVGMHQKTRNQVRKSLKQGFVFEDGSKSESAWRFLIEEHEESMRVLGGKPKPESHFDMLRNQFPDRVRLSMAKIGESYVAALLTLRYAKTVEYLTPVVNVEWRSRQPLSFLIHSVMLDEARNGAEYWNWGGTWPTQESLLRFKSRWGSVNQPYSYKVFAEGLSESYLEKIPGIQTRLPFYFVYPNRLLM